MTLIQLLFASCLTVLWVLLTQDASPLNMIFGLLCAVIGLLAVRRANPEIGTNGSRLRAMVRFMVVLLVDLIRSSLWLAWDLITPNHRSTPLVVAVPLRVGGDGPITALGSAITLTPGTLTVDVGIDRQTGGEVLLIHALYSKEVEEVRQEIHDIEERLIPCLSSAPPPLGESS